MGEKTPKKKKTGTEWESAREKEGEKQQSPKPANCNLRKTIGGDVLLGSGGKGAKNMWHRTGKQKGHNRGREIGLDLRGPGYGGKQVNEKVVNVEKGGPAKKQTGDKG